MEVQQLQAIGQSRLLQLREQIEHLTWIQTELGLVTARVLPLARADGSEPNAHAEERLHVQRARLFDHAAQLRRLLDHDEARQPQLATDQREPHVLAVLVPVADHHTAGARQREHGHELRLRAGFEPKAADTSAR